MVAVIPDTNYAQAKIDLCRREDPDRIGPGYFPISGHGDASVRRLNEVEPQLVEQAIKQLGLIGI